MRELATGLWHWEAPHPDWKPGEEWDQMVSSYAIEDGGRVLLFDPLALPSELEQLAAGRESAIVLTCPWHERDTQGLTERLGAPVFTPAPESQEDLMRKYGITAEQAAGGSPDLAWLRASDTVERHFVSAGDRLRVGVETFPGIVPNEVVLWVESHGAVIAGDTLIDRGRGLEIPAEWLSKDATIEQVAEGLRPLLELPVEHVLAAHGGPHDPADLERALS